MHILKLTEKDSKNENYLFTMCWFGFYQPYATSIVHVPEHIISPKELNEKDLIFIWDKYMKADLLTNLLKISVPWSPAFLKGYERKWNKTEDGTFIPELIKNELGNCMGAVLLISRLSKEQLQPLINDYNKRGYFLKENSVLIGDLSIKVKVFLP